jgi:hypothetical protein
MRLVAFGGPGMLEIFEKIAAQWANVMQNPAVLVPIFTLGFGVGCAVAWLILNQRLKHHRDRGSESQARR